MGYTQEEIERLIETEVPSHNTNLNIQAPPPSKLIQASNHIHSFIHSIPWDDMGGAISSFPLLIPKAWVLYCIV